MRIVYANAHTGDGDGGESPPGPFHPYQRSHQLLSNEPVMYFSYDDAWEYAKAGRVDLMLFEGPSERLDTNRSVLQRIRSARELGVVTVCMGGDYFYGWTRAGGADSFVAGVDALKAAAAVICRHPLHVPYAKRLTDSPVYQWCDYMTTASLMEEGYPPNERTLVAMPFPPLFPKHFHTERSSIPTMLVLQGLHERFPQFEYVFLTQATASGRLGEMFGLPLHGAPGLIFERNPLSDYLVELSKCRLLVNMDCSHTGGGYIVDACAVGTPNVCTGFTAAGYIYNQGSQGGMFMHPYDIEPCIEYGSRLLNDEPLWGQESRHARTVSARYTAAAGRSTMERIYNEAKKGRA